MLVALGVSAGEARAQFFSPGALARPHAALEGLNNCSKCHDQQQRQSPERCLACHTELVPGIARHDGLHGRMSAETRDACQRCHPDHRGVDFALVDWQGDKRKFQHPRTGFALQGKHAQIRCEDCHDRARLVVPDVAHMLAREPGRTTFLGLSTRCESCHFDEHRGQLGRECQRCHTETAWRPTPAFNHQSTAFPLRGKHKPVPCGKCHPSVTDEEPPPAAAPFLKARTPSFLQMKPIDHETCASCHDDPHEGKLGPRCASCHTETGWRAIAPAGGIDRAFHKRTAFPLAGAHALVPCRSCHGPFPGVPARFKGLAFARCGDCHEDAHVGQLAAREGKPAGDCAACHDVTSFTPPRFELEQHARTRFPLDGGHRVSACRGCHPIDARLEAMVPAAVRTRLRREGRPALQISTAVLRPRRSPRACSGCHEDIHQGQFAEELRRSDCRACHTTSSFTALKFDHEYDSRFPLTGAHLTIPCAGCHRPESIRAQGPPVIRYQPLPITCGGCHADQHQGQFTWEAARAVDAPPARRATAPDCSFCHRTGDFKQTLFSHADQRFTRFALRGRHAELACGACHRPVAVREGIETVRYRPLPQTCAGCHVDFHKGDFQGFAP